MLNNGLLLQGVCLSLAQHFSLFLLISTGPITLFFHVARNCKILLQLL
jgi:hypothetical protein